MEDLTQYMSRDILDDSYLNKYLDLAEIEFIFYDNIIGKHLSYMDAFSQTYSEFIETYNNDPVYKYHYDMFENIKFILQDKNIIINKLMNRLRTSNLTINDKINFDKKYCEMYYKFLLSVNKKLKNFILTDKFTVLITGENEENAAKKFFECEMEGYKHMAE